jgi:hypothetical protein
MATLRARLTRRQIALGTALIIIGVVILNGSLWVIKDVPFFFLAGFMAVGAIMFGWAVMASFPIKALLKSLLVMGLWVFLFLLPLFFLPLPPEVPPLVGSFSLLLLVLMFVCYEKWNKGHKKSTEKEEK